ncbi:hypothetical protein LWI28_010321 [Acer negundo]|uniref:Protein APEM9 n=1 Tax=Acer negundo TaxID=4023 RepID=A0AAD5NWY2_ACENE|nr:hypothetical protein LWI28_010321 [Acer negundo]
MGVAEKLNRSESRLRKKGRSCGGVGRDTSRERERGGGIGGEGDSRGASIVLYFSVSSAKKHTPIHDTCGEECFWWRIEYSSELKAASPFQKPLLLHQQRGDKEMGEIGMCTSPSIWEKIEQSESYLVCSMYEEAASLASSIVMQIRGNINVSSQVLYDMMESAGMVLVQSLKELGRAANILNELKLLFDSVTDIPVQVLLTGACFQISERSYFGVREFLEEFLSKWTFVDERCYVVKGAEKHIDLTEGYDGRVLKIDQYVEVVEVYAVTFLGTVLTDVDLAVSWIEKASIPEETRQVLLRRLHSLRSLKATSMSQSSSMLPNKHTHVSERSSKGTNADYLPVGEDVTKQATLNLPRQSYPSFLWSRSSTLKFGNVRMVISTGKVSLGFLIFLAYYIFRRKQATLKRIATRQYFWVKKTLVDLWQLAFSYQVNPLAAVQPLPAATTLRGQ